MVIISFCWNCLSVLIELYRHFEGCSLWFWWTVLYYTEPCSVSLPSHMEGIVKQNNVHKLHCPKIHCVCIFAFINVCERCKEKTFVSSCVRMHSFIVLSWKSMAVYLDDLMVRPSSNEEKQKHCVGQRAQWVGWGHSEIALVETLMLLLTWLALETTLAGTPKTGQ